MTANSPITRFAPSPTGHLHIGGVRTALFCWAYARRHSGRFVLRIEDTDQKRSTEDAARGILEDLAWLGIAWDDGPEFASTENGGTIGGDARNVGPFNQSDRLEIYARYLRQLLDCGRAYPAFETADELAAMRAEAQARKETYRYRQRADYDHAAAMQQMKDGETCVIRFRMPDTPVHVTDAVLGEIEFDEQHTDDFVIRKADGFPTYHFAVVVDDELMGVTHILRGQEHLNNTPRHVALQQALVCEDGTPFRTPVYAHMPLIFNPDGSKMSKRDKDKIVRKAVQSEPDAQARIASHVSQEELDIWLGDKTRQLPPATLLKLAAEFGLTLPEIDVEDFRRSGYLPEALCNYLALLGWNPGMKNEDGTDLERFDMGFLREHFSLERIGKSNAKFDREKLAAFNQAAIAALPTEEFAAALRRWCERYDTELPATFAGERFTLFAGAVQPRIKTLSQCREPIAFALTPDAEIVFDEKAVAKALHKGEPNGLTVLSDFRETLTSIESFEPEAIEAAVKAFCEAQGLGMGKLAQPLRVAITGSNVSPGLGETLALVGKESAAARIERCLQCCSVSA